MLVQRPCGRKQMGASEENQCGRSLEGTWGGMKQTTPEREARADAEESELYAMQSCKRWRDLMWLVCKDHSGSSTDGRL